MFKLSHSKFLLVLVAASSLIGCISAEERAVVVDISTMGAPAEPATSQVEHGTVIVHRNRDFEGLLGAAFRPPVLIDGQEVGQCAKNEILVVELAPGTHTISTRSESDNTRNFAIEAGEVAYIRCDYTVGIIVPNMNLTFETYAEGVEITNDMRRQ